MGLVSLGLVSLGLVSLGLVILGLVSLGLVSLGLVSLGLGRYLEGVSAQFNVYFPDIIGLSVLFFMNN